MTGICSGTINVVQKPPVGSTIDWTNPLAQGIVGCWLFNENTGSILNDISGNNNHGTIYSATWTTNNNGLDFKGVGYADCGNSTVFDFGTGPFTWMYWMYINNIPGTYGSEPVAKWDYIGGVSHGISNRISPDLTFTVYFNGYPVTLPNALSLNKWISIAVTRDSTGIVRLYKNSTEIVSATRQNNINTTYNLTFGAASDLSRKFDGILNRVYIYNRALSGTEIQQLYTDPYAFILLP